MFVHDTNKSHAVVEREREAKKKRVLISALRTHTSTCTPRGKKDESDVKMRRVGMVGRWWGWKRANPKVGKRGKDVAARGRVVWRGSKRQPGKGKRGTAEKKE